VVVTYALIMEGVGDPEESVVEALDAGVDLLLYPPADLPIEEILEGARARGRLDAEGRRRSRERVAALLGRLSGPVAGHVPVWGSPADRDRALAWAVESLEAAGWGLERPGAVSLFVVDDDRGGPFPPPARDAFRLALQDAGIEVRTVGRPDDAGAGQVQADGAWPLLCVYAEPRGWKGRAGLSLEARESVARWTDACRRTRSAGTPAGVVAFGGPTLLEELPRSLPTLLAWGGEPLMQTAAALWIAGARPAGADPGSGGRGGAG
jgi:hypothetical protein